MGMGSMIADEVGAGGVITILIIILLIVLIIRLLR